MNYQSHIHDWASTASVAHDPERAMVKFSSHVWFHSGQLEKNGTIKSVYHRSISFGFPFYSLNLTEHISIIYNEMFLFFSALKTFPLEIAWDFLSELANFSASNWLGENFFTTFISNTFILLRWPQNKKNNNNKKIENDTKAFLHFCFLNLMLMPIDSALNFRKRNQTDFLNKVSVVLRRAAKLEKLD